MREDPQVIPTSVCDVCKQWRIVGIDGKHHLKPTPSSWPNPCYPCAIWSRRVVFVSFPNPPDGPSAA